MATRIAELVFSYRVDAETSVEPGDTLEVSLDCDYCKRVNRTVVFRKDAPVARCLPGSARSSDEHPAYPGKILSVSSERGEKGMLVAYRIEYEVKPFVDAKYGSEIRPWTGRPTWGRVTCSIICPQCSASVDWHTKTNLARPRALHCDCGELLLEELNENPRLRWLDPESGKWKQAAERFGSTASLAYEELSNITKAQAESMLESPERDDIVRALISASACLEDWRWVVDQIGNLYGHPDYWVRNACCLACAHIARAHGVVDEHRFQRFLRRLAEDPSLKLNIQEVVIPDIRRFADPEFSL